MKNLVLVAFLWVLSTQAFGAKYFTDLVLEDGKLQMRERSSTPTDLPNYGFIYPKTDQNLYYLDSSGNEVNILLGGSSVLDDLSDVVVPTPINGDVLTFDGVNWVNLPAQGGIDPWATATDYEINDVIFINDRIYYALTNHTSGVFATDLGNGDWQELAFQLNGIVPESQGGTNADLSGVAVGSLFYQASASTMGQLIGYAVNSYNGINAIHSKSIVDPGAPTSDNHFSYQLNTDVTTAGGNLNQGMVSYLLNYGGTQDIASLTNGFFNTTTSGSATVNSVTGLVYTVSAGDGTNPGTATYIDGFYGNVTINDNYSVPDVRVMNIGSNVGTSASINNFTAQSFNMLFDSPVTSSFTMVQAGASFSAGATVNNPTMFNANPTFDDTVTGNSVGFNFNPTHNGVSNGLFSFYSNPQFNDTASGMTGVYIGGNGTDAPASYQGVVVQSNFAGTGTSADALNLSIAHDVTGNVNGMSFTSSGDAQNINGLNFNMLGNSSNSIYGSNIGISGDATTNMFGENINISGDSADVVGSNILVNGSYSSTAVGIKSDVSGATVPSGTEAISLNTQGGVFSLNSEAELTTGGAFKQANSMNTVATIPSGAANSSDFIGSNMPLILDAQDDHTPGGFGLGIASVGYVSLPTLAAGKTVAKIANAVSAFNDVSSGAGSVVTDTASFRSLGVLTTGGSATFTNVSHFKAETNPVPVGTNIFGVNIEDPAAENYFSKSIVIGGAAFNQVSNSDVALEVASLKAILPPRLTTVQKNALTPIEGMELYDTDIGAPQYYDGASWVTAGAGTGVSAIGAIDSQAKSANGLVISGTTLYAQTADASFPGMVSIGSQTFAGNKTLSGTTNLSALTATRPLKLNGSNDIISSQIDLASSNDVTGVTGATNGGTGLSSYATGDILYSNAPNSLAKLAIQTNGDAMVISGGLPSWSNTFATLKTFTLGIIDSTLTAGRVAFVGTAGRLVDSATFLFNSATGLLTVPATSATSTTLASIPNNPMTTAQRTALTPSVGSCVYDTDLKSQLCYDGTNWALQGSNPETQVIAETSFTGTASCRWNSSSASYGDYTADSDCASPSNRGLATTSDKQPEIVVSSLAAGDYIAAVIARTTFTTATTECEYILTDGTNQWPISGSGAGTTNWSNSGGIVPITLSSAQTNYNLRIQSKKYSGGGECAVYADSTANNFKITLYKVASIGTYSTPSSKGYQIKFTNDSGCAPSYTSGTRGTLNDTDCDFATAQKIGDVITPTTTGDIALKVASVPPGQYLACFDGAFQVDASSGGCSFSATDGTNTIGPTFNVAGTIDNEYNPGVCGLVSYSSTQTNLEWKVQARLTTGATACKGSGASADTSMTMTLVPISNFINGTFLDKLTAPNSTDGAPKTYIATVDCDAGSTITNETYTGTPTIGNISSGACTITIPGGNFSDINYVSCDMSHTESGTGRMFQFTYTSTTSIDVHCDEDDDTNCTDFDGRMTCTQY